MTNEEQKKVKAIFLDPDWFLVKRMFNQYLEGLLDIKNLDLKNDAQAVKGEVKAKIDFYNITQQFFNDADLLIAQLEEQKQSME